MSKYFTIPIRLKKFAQEIDYPNYYPHNSPSLRNPKTIGEFEAFSITNIDSDESVYITNCPVTSKRLKEFLTNIAIALTDPDPETREFANILISWREENVK